MRKGAEVQHVGEVLDVADISMGLGNRSRATTSIYNGNIASNETGSSSLPTIFTGARRFVTTPETRNGTWETVNSVVTYIPEGQALAAAASLFGKIWHRDANRRRNADEPDLFDPSYWYGVIKNSGLDAYYNKEKVIKDGTGVIRGLTIVDDEGNISQYLPEYLIPLYYDMLRDQQFFDPMETEATITDPTSAFYYLNNGFYSIPFSYHNVADIKYYQTAGGVIFREYTFEVTSNNDPVYVVCEKRNDNSSLSYWAYSKSYFRWYYIYKDLSSGTTTRIQINTYNATFNNKGYCWGYHPIYADSNTGYTVDLIASTEPAFIREEVAYIVLYGETIETSPVPQLYNQPNAVVPSNNITGSPDQVLQQLVNNYPTLFDNSVQNVVINADCSQKTVNYIQVPITTSEPSTDPSVNNNITINYIPINGTLQLAPTLNINDPSLNINPDITFDDILGELGINIGGGSGLGLTLNLNLDFSDHSQTSYEYNTTYNYGNGDDDNGGNSGGDLVINPTVVSPSLPSVPTPILIPIIIPGIGSGNAPSYIPPSGQESALWTIYNPTQSQLQQFGAFLWSSSFIDLIKKLFADPMDAVIGVHKIFCNPIVGSTEVTIACGNIDSGVPSKAVTSQYTSVICGDVYLNEYYGNVFDYAPYTKVSIYLPFIGIIPLNVADVMRSKISVDYEVDCFTGACVANITITRDNAGGVIYTYNGSCAVEYPITGTSYNSILSSIIGTAATIGSASLGNPVAAMGSALATSFAMRQHSYERSGTFSGCYGAMCKKKPYLIITRPIVEMADYYQNYDGIPANHTIILANCSGYTKFKELHLKVGNAYADELNEIERLLKEGVIF